MNWDAIGAVAELVATRWTLPLGAKGLTHVLAPSMPRSVPPSISLPTC